MAFMVLQNLSTTEIRSVSGQTMDFGKFRLFSKVDETQNRLWEMDFQDRRFENFQAIHLFAKRVHCENEKDRFGRIGQWINSSKDSEILPLPHHFHSTSRQIRKLISHTMYMLNEYNPCLISVVCRTNKTPMIICSGPTHTKKKTNTSRLFSFTSVFRFIPFRISW